jgi:hypothetical protein
MNSFHEVLLGIPVTLVYGKQHLRINVDEDSFLIWEIYSNGRNCRPCINKAVI